MPNPRKIINDPVYGFIALTHPLLLQIVAHPWYQRLRNIHQMAFAHLVYPGAVHSRLHHSLGAYHLMSMALYELKNKGIPITEEEELAAQIAILLHDVGHGPFSHALERELVSGVHHEDISLLILNHLNEEFNGQLTLAIAIFTNQYHKKFLHQLVSGQLDVDRMDYLNRDSFFTGVAEGVIGYDRIIKMMTVYNDELVIEEKGIYSIEKFLLSRQLMYWQVYLHKTVLGSEKTLIRTIRRAKELIKKGEKLTAATYSLDFFLQKINEKVAIADCLDTFCKLDDYDVMATLKNWATHSDKVLSLLCQSLIERKLFAIKLQGTPFTEQEIEEQKKQVQEKYGISNEEAGYLVFTGTAVNTLYNPTHENIRILFKDGSVKDISEVDNALIQRNLSVAIKKHYFCHIRNNR